MRKIIFISSLVIGIGIGLRLSLREFKFNYLLSTFQSLCHTGRYWICSWKMDLNPGVAGINPDADLDSNLFLPNCLRDPFHLDRLEKNKHLSLLGYVFKLPPDDLMFGLNGSHSNVTGCDGTHYFLGESALTRYALDGVETRVLADLLRWIQFISARYKCIGHIPGVYLDPIGDPTNYMKSIFSVFQQLVRDQVALLTMFPRCEVENCDNGATCVTCSDEIRPDGNRVQRSPRLLIELSRKNPRCACVNSTIKTNPSVSLMNYPRCHPTATRCLYFQSS